MVESINTIFKFIKITILTLAVLALLIEVGFSVWYQNSNRKYEDLLMNHISENVTVDMTYVINEDENFVFGYSNITSLTQINDIITAYNYYISKHADQYDNRFESITINFYDSDKVFDGTPIATARGTQGHLIISDIDYDITSLTR